MLWPLAGLAQANRHYQTASQVVETDRGCVALLGLGLVCGDVQNPALAVDTSTATAAALSPPAALTSVRLRVKLPAVAPAGDRAGLLVSSEAGLDLTALSAVTVSTYLGNSNRARQEFSLGTVLNLVADNSAPARAEFAVTASFDRLELRAGGLLNASYTVRLHQVYSYGDNAPLPVELTAFQGKMQQGAAQLSWQTATERNSRAFVVERAAAPAADNFRPVGEVPSTGAAGQGQHYQYRDASLGQYAAGTRLYYRLRQQDQDGRESFSPVVGLTVPLGEVRLALTPNPADKAENPTVLVQASGLPAAGEVLLYNAQGRQVLRQALLPPAATRLPLPALPPGLYVAAVVDAAGHCLARQRLLLRP